MLLPVLRARVTAVQRPARCRSRARGRARARLARPRVHDYLSARARGERARGRGPVLGRGAVGRAGSVDRGGPARAVPDSTSATRCASTCSAADRRRRSPASATSTGATSRAGGFMFVFRPGVARQAPHSFIAPLRGPERRGRARATSARPGRGVSRTSRSSTCTRSSRPSATSCRNVTLGDHRRRRRWCCSAAC